MKPFLFFLFILSSSLNPILSQPNLLERAKNNPGEGSNYVKSLTNIIHKIYLPLQVPQQNMSQKRKIYL